MHVGEPGLLRVILWTLKLSLNVCCCASCFCSWREIMHYSFSKIPADIYWSPGTCHTLQRPWGAHILVWKIQVDSSNKTCWVLQFVVCSGHCGSPTQAASVSLGNSGRGTWRSAGWPDSERAVRRAQQIGREGRTSQEGKTAGAKLWGGRTCPIQGTTSIEFLTGRK